MTPETGALKAISVAVGAPTSRGVRDAVAGLIDSGAIPRGGRLPPIRSLAAAIGVPPSTIGDAWSLLRQDGYIRTHRRGGTTVETTPRNADAAAVLLDAAHAGPDPRLVPPLDKALVTALRAESATPPRDPISAALRDAASADWPFAADAFTALPSGNAALRTVLDAIGPTAVVAVEDPTLIRTGWAVSDLGAHLIPLRTDAEGPTVESLRAAVSQGADAVVFQPSAGLPAGRMLSGHRRDALAAVLTAAPTVPWIIEENPLGPLAGGWGHVLSLGTQLPSRTVRIEQYWRAFGPDLDLAVVGGAAEVVERISGRQAENGARASALLQRALAIQLADPRVRHRTEEAAVIYTRRHALLRDALLRVGMVDRSSAGLAAWIEVDDEDAAVSFLALRGIRVSPGRRHAIRTDVRGHIRVATSQLADADVDRVASAIAAAARGRSLDDE